MSYPQKISHETILAQALHSVETKGLPALSMRTLAADLGVTPNALYRYFPSKAELAYAMADEAGRLLLNSLQQATQGLPPILAVQAAARAYLQFAQGRPQLYAIKMHHCRQDASAPDSHGDVWGFVEGLAASLQTPWPPQELATTLWAFLHGLVELDRARQLNGLAPQAAMELGLGIMVAGLMQAPPPPPTPVSARGGTVSVPSGTPRATPGATPHPHP